MACNRDESRRRAAALPPEIHEIGDRRAMMPIDPSSRGTWVAANDAGLLLTLLNYNPKHEDNTFAALDARISRGTIIPRLLEARCVADVDAELLQLDAGDFAPFRLVAVDDQTWLEARGNGSSMVVTRSALGAAPLLFASSGLGDYLVDAPRRALFEEKFIGPTFQPAIQDEYHRHSWKDQTHLSVCMRREAAITVSLTTVEVSRSTVSMNYHPGPPDEDAAETLLELKRVAQSRCGVE
ncbi:MAG: NRDE family protein [Phycisphaerae bacterium]